MVTNVAVKNITKIVLILTAFLLVGAVDRFAQYRQVDCYDKYFKQYSRHYFGPDFDWRFFKAQAIAESRFKIKARSEAGAVGIMQIMPRTFKEIHRKNPDIKADPWQPQWNIAAAIFYDRMLWGVWHAKRSRRERLRFMFGAYNAGKRTILTAQRTALDMGLNPYRWEAVAQALPEIQGDGSEETIAYVRDIFTIHQAISED